MATGGADVRQWLLFRLHHEKAEQKLRWWQDGPSLYLSNEKVTPSPDSGAVLEMEQ